MLFKARVTLDAFFGDESSLIRGKCNFHPKLCLYLFLFKNLANVDFLNVWEFFNVQEMEVWDWSQYTFVLSCNKIKAFSCWSGYRNRFPVSVLVCRDRFVAFQLVTIWAFVNDFQETGWHVVWFQKILLTKQNVSYFDLLGGCGPFSELCLVPMLRCLEKKPQHWREQLLSQC